MAKNWENIAKENLTPEEIDECRDWADEKVLEMNLKALRKFVGLTQKDLEKASKIAQGELSKIERRKDHLVSTLRRYVKAMGGELEITARFGDTSIVLK